MLTLTVRSSKSEQWTDSLLVMDNLDNGESVDNEEQTASGSSSMDIMELQTRADKLRLVIASYVTT